MLYRWHQKYTPEDDKTHYATLEEENRALRLEVAELKIEQDILKKPQPTLPNYRNKVSIHLGATGLFGVKAGLLFASVAERLLFMEADTYISGRVVGDLS